MDKKEKEDVMKQVSNEPPHTTSIKIRTLLVFNLIKQGISPADISKRLNKPKTTIFYYIRRLKQEGFIKKLGYGTWEILKDFEEKKCEFEPPHTSQEVRKQVRSHAFIFKLVIPKIQNWFKRKEFLNNKNIDFKDLSDGKVQSIVFRKHKVWLCKDCIVVYFPDWRSYFVESADEGYVKAIYDFEQIVIGLENLLGISLKINKRYQFKVSRQHHSHLKNELARKYNEDKKKLRVVDDNGVFWLLADFSEEQHELETISSVSKKDMDKVVIPFFNQLRTTELMPNDILNMFSKVAKIQEDESTKMAFYAENIKSHTEAIIKLSDGIDDLIGMVKKKKRVKKIPSYIG